MALRTAHGAARNGGAVAALELAPPDEQPPAAGAEAARVDRDALGRFTRGNAVCRTSRLRAGARGDLAGLEAKGDPAWRAADRWSRTWARQRLRELTTLHGDPSAEVFACIEDARQAMADARWSRSKAAELDATDAERADRLRAEARQLRTEARTHRLQAWEIASREGQARRKAPRGMSQVDEIRRIAMATPVQDGGSRSAPVNGGAGSENASTGQPEPTEGA